MPVRITPAHRDRRVTGFRGLGLAAAACLAASGSLRGEPFETIDPTPSVLARDEAGGPQPAFSGATTLDSVAAGAGDSGSWLIDGGSGFATADVTGCASGCNNGQCQTGGGHCHNGPCCPDDCCDAPGLMQYLGMLHHRSGACWTGRADALILWRNAPAARPLYDFNNGGIPAGTALNANQLESPAAGGARVALLRKDQCGGIWEFGYLYGGQFFSQKPLPFNPGGYLTAAPGIYGNDSPPVNFLDAARARLVGSLQTAEVNRRWCHGTNIQFLAGFRWLQWYEMATLEDSYASNTENAGADFYQTSCVNNLFGGQIGLDALLWTAATGFRLEGLVKAGAYGNNAAQRSAYTNVATGVDPYTNSVGIRQSPASCSFVGEVGLTGVLPLSDCWDFRFGYVGLWLTGLAQPTNQLSGQSLALGNPTLGTLSTTGTVIVQGASFGLEGRW